MTTPIYALDLLDKIKTLPGEYRDKHFEYIKKVFECLPIGSKLSIEMHGETTITSGAFYKFNIDDNGESKYVYSSTDYILDSDDVINILLDTDIKVIIDKCSFDIDCYTIINN